VAWAATVQLPTVLVLYVFFFCLYGRPKEE
jgi:hypothetical protein